MNTRLTPRPWRIVWERCSCSEYGCNHPDYAMGLAAQVDHRERFLFYSENTLDADMYLMAAAPDLLAACEQARDALNELIGADYDRGGDIAILDAAIAKAKGATDE